MRYDLNMKIQIANHALDDSELLEIFFSKHSCVAMGEIE